VINAVYAGFKDLINLKYLAHDLKHTTKNYFSRVSLIDIQRTFTMRLLNTTNLQLEEFASDAIPSYAILSHRWESEEVTF
jgi:hypothetical protein